MTVITGQLSTLDSYEKRTIHFVTRLARFPRTFWGLLIVGLGFSVLAIAQNGSFLASTDVSPLPLPSLEPAQDPVRLPTIPFIELPPPPPPTPASVPSPPADPVAALGIRVAGRTFGTSVRGRPLWVYTFGQGEEAVFVIGAIHGNEKSTALLSAQLANHLVDNPGDIPAGVRVLVIPIANPDGYLNGQRTNARRVDLNRNFGTGDWQPTSQASGGRTVSGGSNPFSEPEAQALQDLLQEERPTRLIALHAQGEVVNPEPDEGSRLLARTIVDLTGYRYEEEWVYYQTTGTLTLWATEAFGTASVTWELSNYSNPEWDRNKDALLAGMRGTGLVQGAAIIRFQPIETIRFSPITPGS